MRACHCIFWGLVVKAESPPEISSRKRFYAGLCKLKATMGVRPRGRGAPLLGPKAQVRMSQEELGFRNCQSDRSSVKTA